MARDRAAGRRHLQLKVIASTVRATAFVGRLLPSALLACLCSAACARERTRASRDSTALFGSALQFVAENSTGRIILIDPRLLPMSFDSVAVPAPSGRVLSSRDFPGGTGALLTFADTTRNTGCPATSKSCPSVDHLIIRFSVPSLESDSARISYQVLGFRALPPDSIAMRPGYVERSILKFRRDGSRWIVIGRRPVSK